MAENKRETKILLVQSPPWGVYAPPLGIAYLATFLKSSGYKAEIFDLNMDIFCSTQEIREKWDIQDFVFWDSGAAVDILRPKLESLARSVLSYDPYLVGFSTTFASVPFMNLFLPILKDMAGKEITIILGGGGVSYKEGRSLFKKDFIDYFIVGEGEHPLLHMLDDLFKGKVIATNENYITWKDAPDDRVRCIRPAENKLIPIDEIPFPTFEEFDLEVYTQKDLIPLISSRGCIRSCVFCCDSPIKKPYRVRDPEKVASEIAFHVNRYNRKRFEFSDLLINGNLSFLDKLCDFLIDMDMDVAWGGQATARKDMDITLLKKMKKAGCGGLTFGMESFSNSVLKLMRKGITNQVAKETLAKAKEADMLVEVNLIVGFPGETEQDVDETINFVRENVSLIDKINSLNICTVGAGMHIYGHLAEYNIDKEKITDWYAWFTDDMSNTIEVRENRHKKMLKIFTELNLIPAWQNVKK